MNKPRLYCYFTRIVLIELSFIVAFLLIRKTWDDQFAVKLGGGEGNLKNGEDPGNAEMRG